MLAGVHLVLTGTITEVTGGYGSGKSTRGTGAGRGMVSRVGAATVTLALVRYLVADVLRSQRWVAPLLAFLGGVAVFNVAGGPLLTTYADTATVLLPISVWLTVVVANAEDATQAAITAVTVGGHRRLRLAKLLTAWTGCGVLTVVAVLWPLIVRSYSGAAGTGDVAAGVAAHLLVALFGVGVGSLGMRAVLGRAGWTVLAAAVLCRGRHPDPPCAAHPSDRRLTRDRSAPQLTRRPPGRPAG